MCTALKMANETVVQPNYHFTLHWNDAKVVKKLSIPKGSVTAIKIQIDQIDQSSKI